MEDLINYEEQCGRWASANDKFFIEGKFGRSGAGSAILAGLWGVMVIWGAAVRVIDIRLILAYRESFCCGKKVLLDVNSDGFFITNYIVIKLRWFHHDNVFFVFKIILFICFYGRCRTLR